VFGSHKSIKRLLVMRFSAMGDVAMTVPVLQALATQHPDLRITILTRTRFVPMFEWLPANVQVRGIDFADYDMLVLPGGIKGTNNLKECEPLKEQLVRFKNEGKGIAAICAAPTVFGELGLLTGNNATCNPGFWEELRANGANVIEDSKVVVNGNIITSQAMGTSVDFGLALVGFLCGEEEKEALRTNIRFGAI
jgi:4-methyl-5(b-hydroxyethyl)-thiazole monophosphate biosynthesis